MSEPSGSVILSALAGHAHLCVPPVPFTVASPFVTACGIHLPAGAAADIAWPPAARSLLATGPFWLQKDPRRPSGADYAEKRGGVCDACKQKEAEIRDQ
jgi:hypothetical protein